MKNRKYDLEERLIDFVLILDEIIEQLTNSRLANHLSGHLVRSCTSPALNYGYSQSAESQKDLVHKMQIILKELRETKICLRLIFKKKYIENDSNSSVLKENEELIAVFSKSVKTAKSNI